VYSGGGRPKSGAVRITGSAADQNSC
jgi:hypothetical protein